MNSNQVNKSRMYGSVDLVLEIYSSLIAQFEEIVEAHKRLKDGQQLIGQNRLTDITGLTTNRIQLRGNVIKSILKFSTALMDYAIAVKDVTLKTNANYSVSKLKIVADPLLFDIGVILIELASPIRTELKKYFVSEAEYTEMVRLLSAYNSAIPQRRVATAESKASATNIDEVIQAQDKLLEEEMDVLMLPFDVTQPDLYYAYKNARIIVDYSDPWKTKTDSPDEYK